LILAEQKMSKDNSNVHVLPGLTFLTFKDFLLT